MTGFYSAIAVVFIALAGLSLHRLVAGPDTLKRFSVLFAIAFIAYSIVWCLLYFTIKGKLGEIFGSAFGLAAFCAILLRTFQCRGQFLPAWGVMFLLSTLGYYAGEPFHGWLPGAPGILIWGFCYGAGFGAGSGYVIHVAQEPVRASLTTPAVSP